MDKESLNEPMAADLLAAVRRTDGLMKSNELDYVADLGTLAARDLISRADGHMKAIKAKNRHKKGYKGEQAYKDWWSLCILMARLCDILREVKRKGHL